MVENRDKPLHPRTYPREDTLVRFFKSLTVNRKSVEQVLEYFESGKLPQALESFSHRIPDFIEPGMIGIDGTNLVAASVINERFLGIEVAYVYFKAAEGAPADLERMKRVRDHEEASGNAIFAANWRFSNCMSLEENLTEFTADIFSPRKEIELAFA